VYKRIDTSGILRLGLIVLVVVPLLDSQTVQFKRKRAVYVLAVRDSHLFTMCPTTESVTLPGGKVWKSDGNASVTHYYPDHATITFFDDDRPVSVLLPLPVTGAGKGMSSGQPLAGRAELDRVAPDPEINNRIEKEFLKRKEYALVDSPLKADFVFLAEGTYLPMQIGKMSTPSASNGVAFKPLGDYKAAFLQVVFAIVVPASAFNSGGIRNTALIDARLWEGSATWRITPTAGGEEIAPASPEDVVAQFHNKEKRPPDHFPLCAASSQTLLIAGQDSTGRVRAQDLKTGPGVSSAPAAPAQEAAGRNQAIRVEVTLVTVPVMVLDSDGKYVSDLKDSDFRIFEDNVKQKIDRIIPEAEPFDMALMVDTSASMHFKAEEIQDSAQAFVSAARPDDRLMVVSFDNRIFIHSELTADRLQVRGAISLMQPDEGTRLYDAIDLVLADRLDRIRGRKAIILFTDGVDTRSRIAGASDTLAAIEESDVLVYAIQYDTSSEIGLKPLRDLETWVVLPQDARNNTERYARADKYLFNLCNGSGGQLYVAQAGSNLNEVFARLADQLSHQFTLCYYPSNPKQDGSFHRLRVEVDRPGVKVRSRTGYRASGQQPPGK
jgi:VWFA-related protein